MNDTPTETTGQNIMSFYYADEDRVVIEKIRQMAKDADRSISWVMLDLVKKALA